MEEGTQKKKFYLTTYATHFTLRTYNQIELFYELSHIDNTTNLVIPVVEHWMKTINGSTMRDRSDGGRPTTETTGSYISLKKKKKKKKEEERMSFSF